MPARMRFTVEKRKRDPQGRISQKGRLIASLALLWRLIARVWEILILGVAVGVLGNAVYTYAATGKLDFTDPRTLTLVSWLHAHLAPCVPLLLVGLPLTLCAFLAHRQQKKAQQQQQQLHHETFVAASQGVQRALDELATQPLASLSATSSFASIDKETAFPKAVWNVPFHRNPFFTGRENQLRQLHNSFTANEATALIPALAISGLGGIGKTQIAVEYAYRYSQDYQAVLWTRAHTVEALVSGFVAIAELLQVSQQEQDRHKIVQAVKDWLRTHDRWLLILDNADDLTLVRDFLPKAGAGHLLLTTRAVCMGQLASRMEVETLDQETGALFLLRRAGVLATGSSLDHAAPGDLVLARELVGKMGGLPLALDQAGAYIEETQCSLADYLCLYSGHRAVLLQERGGPLPDHPESVATTWSLSFAAIEQTTPVATDLLRVCAFLQPDAIPEEIMLEGAQFLGSQIQAFATDPLALNRAMNALLSYSLIRRNPTERLLTIHRLVQAILYDAMGKQEREQRIACVVQALNAAFPETRESVTYEMWEQCKRLTPHVLHCVGFAISQSTDNGALAALLTKTADYLRERAQYTESESLYRQALHIWKRAPEPDHPGVAHVLNGLASISRDQGKYEQAESLYLRALNIYEHTLGSDHPLVAHAINGMANVYSDQGKDEQAEPLYQRALHIWQRALGPDHPLVAHAFNGLANVYRDQGRYEQAELLYWQALHVWKHVLGPDHPGVADLLNNLAELYSKQGKHDQAEPLYRRALSIREHALAPRHPDLADTLHGLAALRESLCDSLEAVSLYQRALAIREQAYGLEHPKTMETRRRFIALLHAT